MRPPTGYQPLANVLAVVCLGILVDRYRPSGLGVWLTAALVAWAVWVWIWRRGRTTAAWAALAVALTATAAGWHHARWNLFPRQEIGLFSRAAGTPIFLEAIALSAPRRVPAPPADPLRSLPVGDRSRLEIVVTAVRDRDVWRPASGDTTLIIEGHLLGVQGGDRLRVVGQLAASEPPANPGEFDFAAHSRRSRQLCSLRSGFPEAVQVAATDSAGIVSRGIDGLRTRGAALLARDLARPQARLASAMFLGLREDVEPDESQAFMETGTIHLLVISGLNVGILATCLLAALRLGPWRIGWTLAGVAGGTLLYAVVTGGHPPVVRATIMVLLMCLARALGRRALELNVWAAAALVVLALNPAELFSPGTQLSFLCVAVLIWLNEHAPQRGPTDPLDRLIDSSRSWPDRLARAGGRRALRLFVASLVIWLVVCPLIMARFHLISPVAIVLGPLVSIPVALAMGAGFGVFGFGSLAPPLAALCGRVCDWNLELTQWAVQAARHWPGGHFWVAGPGDWWLAGFYGLLAVLALGLVRLPRRWCLAALAGWCALGLGWGWQQARHRDGLDCTFVSVGHGSAVVLRLPDGKTLLYDAGRMGSPAAGERAIAGVLWSAGVRHLDAVVLSHADLDHYNALPALLAKFSVGVVYVSPLMFEEQTAALAELRRAIDAAGVPLAELAAGDRLRAGDDCLLEVSHPPRKGVLGSDNANSVVLSVEYQGRRILLTGDLESPGLDDVLAERPYDTDILMAPHHGSRFSDPPGIAGWSTPEWVVISGSQRDRLPTVEAAYSGRGCQVLHTAAVGAIEARIAGGQIKVAPWAR